MRRVRPLTLLLCGLLLTLTACGQAQSASTIYSTPPNIPQGEMLYVLDGSAPSSIVGQRIVSFHPGTTLSTSLPTGLFSQDHQHIYTAIPQNGHTTIMITNTQGSIAVRTFTIAGTYSTASSDYTKSVLSANGRWLALRQLEQTGTMTTFALVDTQKGTLAKTFTAQGDFDLDAVSPDGSRVFLLERLHDTTGHYYVRRYDVSSNQLFQGIIADKSEINDPRMLGSGLTRQMAQDGSRAYTLYTDARSNIAFVHILPLMSNFNGARCINLPAGKSSSLLSYYTLALSADGSLLYATNAALGVTVVISVTDKDAFSDDIVTTIHFSPLNAQIPLNKTMRTLYNGAALSSDQSMLYAVGTRGIVAIHLADEKMKQSYAQQQTFTGIALSMDNKTLYAVSPNEGITLINLQSGQAQQIAPNPVHAPWGIEWVTHV